MSNPPEPKRVAALFRMLEARLGLAAIGLVAGDGRRPALAFATPELRRLWPEEGETWSLPGMPAAGGPVDPRAYGLPAGFAALWPLAPPWALIVHDRRPRRLTATLGAALEDAALLLAAPPPAPVPVPTARPGEALPPRGAILPRAAACKVIEAALRAAEAARAPAPLLFMIGLDRFRSVNEALGVAAGDALLAMTGARLEGALGPGDRLSRLEGDRFLVIVQSSRQPADRLAAHLIEVIRQPIALAGRHLTMGASIGVVAAGAAMAAPTLLLRADGAMRRAKTEGRGRIAFHEPDLDSAAAEASQLEIDLAGAPENGQMRLNYQPFVDLASGAVAGAEALMRWQHPTRGEVGPTTFIPLAESTGLILPLGLWALRSACRAALGWPPAMTLAVNISALQFHQPGFIGQVEQVLAETGFPAARLELEVTETVLMRDDPGTLGQLRALIERGIRIALDDFGTGYSALAYLARLPHHRIKLDKSFVGDLANPATAALIRAIVSQARANGVGVTAEGVERPEQIEEVRAMGFTHAQGYATGLPVPEPVLTRARARHAIIPRRT